MDNGDDGSPKARVDDGVQPDDETTVPGGQDTQEEKPSYEYELAGHASQLTVPEEVHAPSDEERLRVTVGPKDPTEQYQVYEVDAGAGDGLIAFV